MEPRQVAGTQTSCSLACGMSCLHDACTIAGILGMHLGMHLSHSALIWPSLHFCLALCPQSISSAVNADMDARSWTTFYRLRACENGWTRLRI